MSALSSEERVALAKMANGRVSISNVMAELIYLCDCHASSSSKEMRDIWIDIYSVVRKASGDITDIVVADR